MLHFLKQWVIISNKTGHLQVPRFVILLLK